MCSSNTTSRKRYRRRRTVQFSQEVQVRECDIVLGDTPAVDGPSWSLGWIIKGESKEELNSKTSRTRQEMRIPAKHRAQYLLQAGYSTEDLRYNIHECQRVHLQRLESREAGRHCRARPDPPGEISALLSLNHPSHCYAPLSSPDTTQKVLVTPRAPSPLITLFQSAVHHLQQLDEPFAIEAVNPGPLALHDEHFAVELVNSDHLRIPHAVTSLFQSAFEHLQELDEPFIIANDTFDNSATAHQRFPLEPEEEEDLPVPQAFATFFKSAVHHFQQLDKPFMIES